MTLLYRFHRAIGEAGTSFDSSSRAGLAAAPPISPIAEGLPDGHFPAMGCRCYNITLRRHTKEAAPAGRVIALLRARHASSPRCRKKPLGHSPSSHRRHRARRAAWLTHTTAAHRRRAATATREARHDVFSPYFGATLFSCDRRVDATAPLAHHLIQKMTKKISPHTFSPLVYFSRGRRAFRHAATMPPCRGIAEARSACRIRCRQPAGRQRFSRRSARR